MLSVNLIFPSFPRSVHQLTHCLVPATEYAVTLFRTSLETVSILYANYGQCAAGANRGFNHLAICSPTIGREGQSSGLCTGAPATFLVPSATSCPGKSL
jgi:hypothetical protein